MDNVYTILGIIAVDDQMQFVWVVGICYDEYFANEIRDNLMSVAERLNRLIHEGIRPTGSVPSHRARIRNTFELILKENVEYFPVPEWAKFDSYPPRASIEFTVEPSKVIIPR